MISFPAPVVSLLPQPIPNKVRPNNSVLHVSDGPVQRSCRTCVGRTRPKCGRPQWPSAVCRRPRPSTSRRGHAISFRRLLHLSLLTPRLLNASDPYPGRAFKVEHSLACLGSGHAMTILGIAFGMAFVSVIAHVMVTLSGTPIRILERCYLSSSASLDNPLYTRCSLFLVYVSKRNCCSMPHILIMTIIAR